MSVLFTRANKLKRQELICNSLLDYPSKSPLKYRQIMLVQMKTDINIIPYTSIKIDPQTPI